MLTEDENTDHADLKQKMGLLYTALQEFNILPVSRVKRGKRLVYVLSDEKMNQGEADEIRAGKDPDEASIHTKRAAGREETTVDRSLLEPDERERVFLEEVSRRDGLGVQLSLRRTKRPRIEKSKSIKLPPFFSCSVV